MLRDEKPLVMTLAQAEKSAHALRKFLYDQAQYVLGDAQFHTVISTLLYGGFMVIPMSTPDISVVLIEPLRELGDPVWSVWQVCQLFDNRGLPDEPLTRELNRVMLLSQKEGAKLKWGQTLIGEIKLAALRLLTQELSGRPDHPGLVRIKEIIEDGILFSDVSQEHLYIWQRYLAIAASLQTPSSPALDLSLPYQ